MVQRLTGMHVRTCTRGCRIPWAEVTRGRAKKSHTRFLPANDRHCRGTIQRKPVWYARRQRASQRPAVAVSGVLCEGAPSGTLEHETLLATGGHDTRWNLVPARDRCNRWESRKFATGWKIDMEMTHRHPRAIRGRRGRTQNCTKGGRTAPAPCDALPHTEAGQHRLDAAFGRKHRRSDRSKP